jgi:hypothetical protein
VPLLRFTLLCYAIAPSGWQAWTFLLNHAILLLFKGHSMENIVIAILLTLVIVLLVLYQRKLQPPQDSDEDEQAPLHW